MVVSRGDLLDASDEPRHFGRRVAAGHVAQAELALEVPPADVRRPRRREEGRVAPARDDALHAEAGDRVDAARLRHEVRPLAVPRRRRVAVRVPQLADAVVAPRVDVGRRHEGDGVVASRPDGDLADRAPLERVGQRPRDQDVRRRAVARMPPALPPPPANFMNTLASPPKTSSLRQVK